MKQLSYAGINLMSCLKVMTPFSSSKPRTSTGSIFFSLWFDVSVINVANISFARESTTFRQISGKMTYETLIVNRNLIETEHVCTVVPISKISWHRRWTSAQKIGNQLWVALYHACRHLMLWEVKCESQFLPSKKIHRRIAKEASHRLVGPTLTAALPCFTESMCFLM